jgi:hypothetical protein
MLRRAWSCCGIVLAIGSANAQNAPVVTRRDTLGANYDHTKPGHGTPSDFDFLIGTWRFTIQARSQEEPYDYQPPRYGTWTAKKSYSGLIVEDSFASELPNGTTGLTVTYRVFDSQTRQWHIQGTSSRRGVWQPGIGWSKADERFLVQENPNLGVLTRIRYYAITPTHFLWRADGSKDGGKTWMKDVIIIEANRVSK